MFSADIIGMFVLLVPTWRQMHEVLRLVLSLCYNTNRKRMEEGGGTI